MLMLFDFVFHLLTLRRIFQEVGVCDIYHLRYYRNCCFNDVQFDNIEYLVKTKQNAYRNEK